MWAYVSHRMHWPVLKRLLHKWHHRYVAVTTFGAYFSALAINLVHTGCHAIVIHSGVDFDARFPWEAAPMSPTNHHTPATSTALGRVAAARRRALRRGPLPRPGWRARGHRRGGGGPPVGRATPLGPGGVCKTMNAGFTS